MIDFKREKPISISRVANRFGVHRRTVEGWFRRGLERAKLGGRVYTTLEAIDRFKTEGIPCQQNSQTRELEAALKKLRERFNLNV